MCHLLTPRRPRTRLDNSETGAAARGPARPGLSSVVFYRFVGRGRPPDTTTPALLLRPLPPSRAFSFQFIFEDLTTLSNHSSRPGSEERLHSLTHGRDTPRPRTHTHKYQVHAQATKIASDARPAWRAATAERATADGDGERPAARSAAVALGWVGRRGEGDGGATRTGRRGGRRPIAKSRYLRASEKVDGSQEGAWRTSRRPVRDL